ncbi:SWF or SNF family helicase [Streptomyces sp. NPDC012888]|uniref:SWIM zinc finger family protein n=1 Tax=Streptomyces sp. NPDC012888 TaxID=3364855 RepID=UPI0036B603F0
MNESEYEQVFPALPAASGRGFARTWWGHAWLRALEDSVLEGAQLRHGRRYARGGTVGAVSVRPGRLTAVVRERDGTAHRTDVLLQEFGAAEWDRLLTVAAGRAGHIAALLDRDVPPELAEDAAAAGVDLLPGIGDLEPRCDCGEWDHCAHSAALCYQVARLLDQDPFVLLLLRGRSRRAVLAELEGRSAAGAEPVPEAVEVGVPAHGAFAAAADLPGLPAVPELPPEPGQPPLLDTESQPDPRVLDVDAVEFLARAAAGEAYRLLARAVAADHAELPLPEPPDAPREVARDAARLAAGTSDVRVRARLARASGRDRAALELAVRAWDFGGPAALAVLEEDWTPDRAVLARAAAALAEAEAPALRRVRARWTLPGGSAQLRLDRAERWWPYRREAGRWVPAGPAAPEPGSVLAGLGAVPGTAAAAEARAEREPDPGPEPEPDPGPEPEPEPEPDPEPEPESEPEA